MTTRFLLGFLTLAVATVLAACTPITPPAERSPDAPTLSMANPASVNCAELGGTLTIESRANGEYGVCTFEDNLQCEEWALLRGDCPVGGVNVTGYATAAGRFCAISGGEYAVTNNSGAEDEQGSCTLPDGTVCDAGEYYDGLCPIGD